MTTEVLLRDPWVRGCLAAGALLLAVTTVSGLPWSIWLAWAYVGLLSVVQVARPTT